MSIEGVFLIWFITAFIAGIVFVFLLYDTRATVDKLEKDIDLLETQNARIKDRLLELEIQQE